MLRKLGTVFNYLSLDYRLKQVNLIQKVLQLRGWLFISLNTSYQNNLMLK